jgi:autotransporter translocation and assembly factor TamB
VRLWRIGRRIAGYGVVLAAILLISILAFLQTSWFKRYARDFIVRQSASVLNGQLEIARVGGNFLTGLVLDGVVLRQGDTTPVRIPRATIRYSAWQLARGDAIVIDSLDVIGLQLSVLRTASGGLNLGSLVKKRAPSTGPRRPIDMRSIQIRDADLTFDTAWGPTWMRLPRHITALTATLSLESREGHLTLPIAALHANAFDPEFSVRSFTGVLHFENDGWRVVDGVLRSGLSSLNVSAAFKRSGYDVTADASTFDFPEMARIVPGLKSIDVPASVQLTMRGPQRALDTHVAARSAAGDVVADLALDSTVPGWQGKGRATLTRFDIARWLPTDIESDLTGVADFDLLLGLGRHFPRGRYTFAGPHVIYAGYEATDLRTRGTLIVDRVLIESTTAVAYGSPIRAAGWIDLPPPYGFHLTGAATRLDLRRLPPNVPVPHLRSSLTFDYDATGRFQNPVLAGTAVFADSTFLDAQVAAGARGGVDTSGPLVTYSADGSVAGLDLNQIGNEFELVTLRQPRYAGTVSGGFTLTGAGSSLDDLTIDVQGQSVAASLFGGRFSEMQLDLQVRNASLSGSGRGRFERIDPAIAVGDGYTGVLNGQFDLAGTLPGLFDTGFSAGDSALRGSLTLAGSTINGVEIEAGSTTGEFDTGLASLTALDLRTGLGHLSGQGTVGWLRGASDFKYEGEIPDASRLRDFTPMPIQGSATLRGRLTGPFDRSRVEGTFTGSDFEFAGASALTASGKYTLQGPLQRAAEMTIAANGSASFISAFGRSFGNATANLTYDRQRLQGEVETRLPDGRIARIAGGMLVHADHHELHVSSLEVELGKQRWALSANGGDPVVSWSASAISARDLTFDAGAGIKGRISIAGDLGRESETGQVSVTVQDVSIEDLPPLAPVMAGYRGQLNGTVTISGTVRNPGISAAFRIVNGGVRSFTFQSAEASGRWTGDAIAGDLRIDQAPGVWLTARGTVPLDIFSKTASGKPVDVAVRSSTIDLGLVEGFTTAVRNVVGTLDTDVTVRGTADNPQFDGAVDLKNASFEIPATGVRYRNGQARFAFRPDAVNVEQFHLEDSKGNPVELTGTVATRALKLGDLGFEMSATEFEVLNNGLGELALNGVLTITGTLAAPVITGDIGLHRASLHADELLLIARRPYTTVASADTPGTGTSAAAPSGPSLPGAAAVWDNLTLRLRLLATNNLEFRGEDMRLSREGGTRLGDINVLFGGDLAIRKAPHERLAVSGELETVRGSYAYQGRRFTIEREGTLRFAGDSAFDPLLSITAERTVSGVLIRAALQGQLSAPELQLTSTPSLDESDILSLLLFNQPVNELALGQRNELALQAAALASGFVVSPAVSAVGQALGLDFLELEPSGSLGTTSFRLSAGREIWKGLFVTYAREFGPDPYNEFLGEYELTRYLRLRASASDVATARSRATLFRRVERAGIDLIFFFSY